MAGQPHARTRITKQHGLRPLKKSPTQRAVLAIIKRIDAHKLKISRMLEESGPAATEVRRTKIDKSLLHAIERIARTSIGDGG